MKPLRWSLPRRGCGARGRSAGAGSPGLTAISAASETRLLLPAGHLHHRGLARAVPRCGPWAALSPGRTRPRRPARRPGPPPSFYHRPGLLPPGGDPRLIPLGGPPRRDLHAPADPVQQQVQPRPGCSPPGTGGAPPRRSGPASSTGPHPSPRRPGRRPAPPPARAAAAGVSLHFAPPAPFDGQRRPAAGGQRPPPPVRRHPRHPEPPGHLPVAGPGLDQLRRRQPHLLPAGPLSRVSPPPSGYLMPPAYRTTRQPSPGRNPRH